MARSKKADPAKLKLRLADKRREDFDRVGLQPEASGLGQNQDVSVQQAKRADAAAGVRGNVDRARRLDAFEALKDGMVPGAYDAARRLERDITTARGEHDSGRPIERVDGDEASAGGRTDAVIAASERVRRALGRVGKVDASLLAELIAPGPQTLLRSTSWRDIVQLVTHESHTHGQAAAVRSACANLARAYQDLEREGRERARAA